VVPVLSPIAVLTVAPALLATLLVEFVINATLSWEGLAALGLDRTDNAEDFIEEILLLMPEVMDELMLDLMEESSAEMEGSTAL
jgi:hypothetical protein